MGKSIAKKRYSIRITTDGIHWSSMIGKNGAVYYFSSMEDARAYVPTVWQNVADIIGIRINWDTYFIVEE